MKLIDASRQTNQPSAEEERIAALIFKDMRSDEEIKLKKSEKLKP